MNWLSLWPQYFSQRTLWGVQFFFNAKRKMLFSVLVLGKFCSWGQDSFPLPGGCPGSCETQQKEKVLQDEGRSAQRLLPSQEGREGTSLLLSAASAMCLVGYQGRQRLHMDCPYKCLSIFLKVERYQFFQRNLIKPLLHFYCWIFFFLYKCTGVIMSQFYGKKE